MSSGGTSHVASVARRRVLPRCCRVPCGPRLLRQEEAHVRALQHVAAALGDEQRLLRKVLLIIR
ncbi:MAG: hypothetical protein HC884_18305 [Chloroflexaceae bacterium]|nr:hypothetical protein [Chloroflexaceae bacterium]